MIAPQFSDLAHGTEVGLRSEELINSQRVRAFIDQGTERVSAIYAPIACEFEPCAFSGWLVQTLRRQRALEIGPGGRI